MMEIETTGNKKTITLTRPDDWHLHVRDGKMLRAVILPTAGIFGRAIIMPNLKPPVTTTAMAVKYRDEILACLPKGTGFEPLMTLYLTDNTSPDEIMRAKESGIVHAVKYYPAGATTNSDSGVTDMRKVYAELEEMQRLGMPLLVHGEVTDPAVDIFDREKVFIDRVLTPLLRDFPELRVVFEHVTTKDAVDFVIEAGENVAATITAHHLHINRNDLLVGGIKPHYYCLPIVKGESHRLELVKAATSGNKKFFLGTDSAPHALGTKQNACGCAGCFTAPSAMELYAMAFERAGRSKNLERFASFYGADYYGLPRNTDTITLEKVDPYHLDPEFRFGIDPSQVIVPFMLKEGLTWRVRG